MAKQPTQEDLRQLVQREVHYCVSSLVHTLAQAAGTMGGDLAALRNHGRQPQADLRDLCEQAAELSIPIPDYEEAAVQAGWTGPHKDEFGATFYRDDTDGQTWAGGSWEDLCREFDIEPYEWEVFEHWIVSDWLADKLEAHGERVDRDFAGLTVWARTTTGQSIYMDAVIADIWRELHSADA